MNQGVIEMQIWQFSLIYLLLLIVLYIMKKCQMQQSKLLVLASVRMTAQLTLAGLLLTYIFKNPHPVLTLGYIFSMIGFAIYRVLSQNPTLNQNLKQSSRYP